MSVIPPQPGVLAARAVLALAAASLRADVALVEHVLEHQQDEKLRSAIDKLRSAIEDLDARIAELHATAAIIPPDPGAK
jgi:uncharacterized protein involved in exopolysaccharide biosynthesis